MISRPSPPVYSVTHPSIDAARLEMVAVCDANLPGEHHLSRYNWHYEVNPVGRGEVYLLSAKEGAIERVVGCTGMAPRLFVHGADHVRALLSADFAVDKEHRTVLPAVRLQRAATTEGRAGADILYGFPNLHAVGVFERVGYRVLGRMQRYVKVLDYTRYLKRLPTVGPAAGLAGAVANTAVRAMELKGAVRRTPGKVAWLDRFDDRFTALGTRMTKSAPIVGVRTAEWLTWRYAPAGGVTAAIAAYEVEGHLQGYAVVTRKGGTARIADFGAESSNALGALFTRLSRELRATGVQALELYYLGPEWVDEILRRQRFVRRDSERPVVVTGGRSASDLLFDPRNWYLTWADADT